MENKYLAREARIITEKWDGDQHEKYPNGLKNPASETDNWMLAIETMNHELHSWFDVAMRYELSRFLNEKYSIHLDIESSEFQHDERVVQTFREIPGNTSPNVWRGTLKEMPAYMSREVFAEILAIVPGGLQYFRNIAEESPYLF